MATLRRASIDLGTNTCLLLIVDWDPEQRHIAKVLWDQARIVRLGEGVDARRELLSLAIQRTLHCLSDYSHQVQKMGIQPADVACVATSQARDAVNRDLFFKQIQESTGFRFQTLTGEQEAQFTFLGGLLPGMKPEQAVVIDIGGGSTELMSYRGGQSLDVGSVRFTERYLKTDPVTDEEFWTCQDHIDEALESLCPWRETLFSDVQFVAVAGTATTLAAWHLGLNEFDSKKVDQVTFLRGDVHRMVEELKWRTVQERKLLPGVEEGRADVLLAGALILWRAMEVLNFPTCRVSTRGLRYGILWR